MDQSKYFKIDLNFLLQQNRFKNIPCIFLISSSDLLSHEGK